MSSSIQHELQTINHRLDSVENDVARLRRDVDEIRRDVDALRVDVDALRVDVDALRVDVNEIRRTMVTKDELRVELRAHGDQLRRELGAEMASHFGAIQEFMQTQFELLIESQRDFVRRDELRELLQA
jgi:predicted  nucleic acid-binding Zn-ribbon protein